MSVAGTLSEIAAWVEPAVGGWRFLFSPIYRAGKRHDWQHERLGYVLLDVVGGTIGVAASLGLACVIAIYAWRVVAG